MTLNSVKSKAKATLSIPFDNADHATIAYQTLNVDKEPGRNFVQKELELKGLQIVVHFTADQVKNLRTAITSFFENLLLCQEAISSYGEQTEIKENAGTYTRTVA